MITPNKVYDPEKSSEDWHKAYVTQYDKELFPLCFHRALHKAMADTKEDRRRYCTVRFDDGELERYFIVSSGGFFCDRGSPDGGELSLDRTNEILGVWEVNPPQSSLYYTG